MMKLSSLIRRFLFLATFVPLFSVAAQTSPSLEFVARLPAGAVDLKLTGTPGTHYTIEASENLSFWFPLSSGVATDGILSFRHEAASDFAALFYRAIVTVNLLPPVTVGLLLNTNTTVTALADIRGGSAELVGTDGTRYTLTIASNSIPAAQLFTMTEVTNLTGLPFARRPIGAVKIEPADLLFWGAATLEISFRTNIDRRQIASFASRSDGTGFQLMIDRVGTNRIMIPITKAGVYGSVVTTVAEIEEMARHEIAPPPEVAAQAWHSMAAGECEAAEKAAARTAERQIRQAFAPFSQEIAARIGVARQQQLMGTPEDSTDPFEDIEERLCQLYQTHVAPRWSQAAVNCALAKVLLQFSIGLQRQLSLLGNEYTCIDMGTTTMCVLFNNCLQEIRECCEAGNKGSTKIAEILGVVRQDALMGGNCISESDAQEAFDICSSNVWTGTYSVQAIGYTNITHSDAFSTRVHIDDFVSTFTGSVIESTESGSAANGYIVQLRVAGEITVSDFSMDSIDFKTECGSRYRIVSSRIVAAAPTQYTVTLSTRPDGSYVVSSFNRTDTHFGAPAVKTSIELDSAQSCEEGASEIVKNKTTIAAAGVFGHSLPFYQGRWNDQHAISGNNAMVDTGRDPDRKLTEQWSFSRQTVP